MREVQNPIPESFVSKKTDEGFERLGSVGPWRSLVGPIFSDSSMSDESCSPENNQIYINTGCLISK